MTRLLLMFAFLAFGALAIFLGLNEFFLTRHPEKNKFEARLEKDFIKNPDHFFIEALRNSNIFEVRRLGKSPDMKLAENFFRDLPTNPNGTQKLELSIFDGDQPNLIVLQFSLFDKSENKIGEWAKSYVIPESPSTQTTSFVHIESEKDKKKSR
jgi:hypothetical protein